MKRESNEFAPTFFDLAFDGINANAHKTSTNQNPLTGIKLIPKVAPNMPIQTTAPGVGSFLFQRLETTIIIGIVNIEIQTVTAA
jgi:hypothetical protein